MSIETKNNITIVVLTFAIVFGAYKALAFSTVSSATIHQAIIK